MKNILNFNKIIISIISLIFIQGCFFTSISLFPTKKPLSEQILEGEGDTKILQINISGFISEMPSDDNGLSGGASMVDYIKESLKLAEKDNKISGILLRINSSGGTVTGSDIIYYELMKFKEKKKIPIYACITDVGASGALYIAMAADKIIAHPTAITGSIGVIAMQFNVEKLIEKIGVQAAPIKSGDKKDIMSPFRATTLEEKEIMQTIINHLYEHFLDVIEKSRNAHLTRREIRKLADGRVYTAKQALDSKLIDKIGYLDETIEMLKKTIGVREVSVISYFGSGGYKGTIYSLKQMSEKPTINLFSLNISNSDLFSGTKFLYIWR